MPMWDYVVGLFCCFCLPRDDPTYYYISYDLDGIVTAGLMVPAAAEDDAASTVSVATSNRIQAVRTAGFAME